MEGERRLVEADEVARAQEERDGGGGQIRPPWLAPPPPRTAVARIRSP